MTDQIVTLIAEKGKKYDETGEVVGSYSRSIVFLPKGVQSGQSVRVKLEPIREDSRGRMMYRGVPAPVEYTEQWKDNGNGTASRVTIATDWLGKTSEEGARDTRALEKCERTPSIQSNLQVVWSQNLATSVIEDRQVRLIPLEEEKVEGGQLIWRKVSERQENLPVITYPVTLINDVNQYVALQGLVNVKWEEWNFELKLQIYYEKDGQEKSLTYQSKWENLPVFVQTFLQKDWPVCFCGRERVDTIGRGRAKDGYPKCFQCRSEETCVRCNKQTVVNNLSGRLVCSDCEPYESAEQLIETQLPHESREAIAAEARKIRSGQALAQAEGEVVLEATVDHITDSWTRDRIVGRWTGYGWYYFADDGVFGTKLAPAALSIIEFLPHASGNGLVELVAWLALGPKPGSSSDYYTRTQMKGEKVTLPPLEDTIQKLAEGTLVLADRLRGSEADRLTILAGYQTFVEKLGKDSCQAKAVAEILQGNEQDYAKAIVLINEYGIRLAERERQIASGEIWPHVVVNVATDNTVESIYVIAADGSEITGTPLQGGSGRKSYTYAYDYGDLPATTLVLKHGYHSYGYRKTEYWEVIHLPKQITGEQHTKVKEIEAEKAHSYFTGRGTGWNLSQVGTVVFVTRYMRSDRIDPRDLEVYHEMLASLPVDVTKWVVDNRHYDVYQDTEETSEGNENSTYFTVHPRQRLSGHEKAIHDLEEQIQNVMGEQMVLDYKREDAQAAYEKAKADCDKAEADYNTRQAKKQAPIEVGSPFMVIFEQGTDRDEGRLIVEPFLDVKTGHVIKLIAAPWFTAPIVGELYFARVVSYKGEVQAFTYYDRSGWKANIYGYYVEAIAEPEKPEDAFSRYMTELETELTRLQAELAKLQSKADEAHFQQTEEYLVDEPFDESGNPNTAMADALQKAGFVK